jgi:hypothetical protein
MDIVGRIDEITSSYSNLIQVAGSFQNLTDEDTLDAKKMIETDLIKLAEELSDASLKLASRLQGDY